MDNVLTEIQSRIDAACLRAGRDPASVTLIGASKKVSPERLLPFLDAGLSDLGENYVQEGLAKIEVLAARPVRWHFIGALQSNKARDVVRAFDLIHSVDRVSLANAIDKAAREQGTLQDVLLQVNIGDESTKAGCSLDELEALARHCSGLPNLRVCGLMCLPPYNDDAEQTRPYFRRLREARDDMLAKLSTGSKPLAASADTTLSRHLSMGMSGDFEVAIEEGATLVRIGTKLFGARS